MSDLERMGATMGLPEQEGEMSLLTGSVPVECIKNYQKRCDFVYQRAWQTDLCLPWVWSLP